MPLCQRRKDELEIGEARAIGVRGVGRRVKNSSRLQPFAPAGNLRANLIPTRLHVREFEIALLIREHRRDDRARGEKGGTGDPPVPVGDLADRK